MKKISPPLLILMAVIQVLILGKLISEKCPKSEKRDLAKPLEQESAVPMSISLDSTCKVGLMGDFVIANGKWPEYLTSGKVENYGVSDFTTKQLSWILAGWVIPSAPDVCFIHGGRNDFFLGIPVDIAFKNLMMIADSLQHNNIQPVLFSTIPVNGYPKLNENIALLNSLASEECKSLGIPFIDVAALLSDNEDLKKEFTIDGMCLNDKGYSVWFEPIAEYLTTFNNIKTLNNEE